MRILIFIAVLLLLDFYVFQGVRFMLQSKTAVTQRSVNILYWFFTAFTIAFIIAGQLLDWHAWPKIIRTYSFALIVIVYLSKLFVTVFLLLDDVVRGGEYVFYSMGVKAKAVVTNEALRISRHGFLVRTGFILASIPFFSLIYGMFNGQYRYQVRKVPVRLPNLPDAFDGLKIVQISDIHAGSFIGSKHLEEAVDLILKQNPDVIFFTGDLVNDLHTEVIEFKETLGRLSAPLGVYSILGNHDYGDYYRWESMEAKRENLEKLKSFQREIGWNLLLNEHTYLERNGEKIGLIAVENYSGHRNFSRYGQLERSLENYQVQPVNVLLSHDPSHWDAQVKGKHTFIDLTLSGHTHGFQYGVEIGKIKWSPVQYVYKQWADLYEENGQKLYVNRGLGFIGYPGRVGILPEITLLTLEKS